jgi:uncharacterized protein (DUF486 family)
MISLPPIVTTVLLLSASNVFMTIAWYGHLKHLNTAPWWIAALVSWGIALFEYLLQVPANRIGYTALPFAVFVMGQPVKMNFVYAGLCLVGAVYFVFKG